MNDDELKLFAEQYSQTVETMYLSEETKRCYFELWQIEEAVKQGYKQAKNEEINRIKEKSKKFNAMSKDEKRKELCRRIKNAISLDIHSNVCYLLNFCDLPQELATELSGHYNAIYQKLREWEKSFND